MIARTVHLSPRYLDVYTDHPSPLSHPVERITIAGQTRVRRFDRRDMDEKDILLQAIPLLTEEDDIVIVGYNSAIFDLPFMSMRAVALDLPPSLISRLRQTYHVDLATLVHNYLQPFGRWTNWRELIPVLDLPEDASKIDVTRELYERINALAIQNMQSRYAPLRNRAIVFDDAR